MNNNVLDFNRRITGVGYYGDLAPGQFSRAFEEARQLAKELGVDNAATGRVLCTAMGPHKLVQEEPRGLYVEPGDYIEFNVCGRVGSGVVVSVEYYDEYDTMRIPVKSGSVAYRRCADGELSWHHANQCCVLYEGEFHLILGYVED